MTDHHQSDKQSDKSAAGEPQPKEHPHRTTAWYGSLDAVRVVEIELERHGVDSVHIVLPDMHPTAKKDRNRVDDETAKWAAGRASLGTLIGAIAGAVVFLLVSFAFVDTAGSVALFAFGGAVFGAFVGFFYGFAVQMPTSPEVFDTFAGEGSGSDATPTGDTGRGGGPRTGVTGDPGGQHWIAVEGPPPVLEKAVQVMEHHKPDKLVTT